VAADGNTPRPRHIVYLLRLSKAALAEQT